QIDLRNLWMARILRKSHVYQTTPFCFAADSCLRGDGLLRLVSPAHGRCLLHEDGDVCAARSGRRDFSVTLSDDGWQAQLDKAKSHRVRRVCDWDIGRVAQLVPDGPRLLWF